MQTDINCLHSLSAHVNADVVTIFEYADAIIRS
jgi:hypothetical protein